MMTEKAKVVALRGERALLETRRQSVCGACVVNKACGTGVIAKYWNAKPLRLEARNDIGARVGEEVLVAVEDRFLVRGSLLVYLLPLLALFTGGLLGSVVGEWLQPSAAAPAGGFELAGQEERAGEGWTIGLALLGLWLGFVGARHWARRLGGRHGLPVIVARSGLARSGEAAEGSDAESGARESDGVPSGTSSLQAVPVRWHTPFSQGGDGT